MNFGTIIIAILVFGLLIFLHELGHFLAARWAGVQVNEFALGMGPVIYKKIHKGTQYAIRLLPIGGFVAMEGENETSESPDSFGSKPVFKRIVIIVAGATMNLVLGFFILVFLSSQMQLMGSTQVAAFNEGAVSNQWLQVGDSITKVNYHKVRTDNDIIYEFVRDADGIMDIEVVRDGKKLLLSGVTFEMQQLPDGIQTINLDFKVRGVEKTTWGVLTNATNWTKSLAKQVYGSLADLIRGRYAINQLSGVVGVTSAIGEATKAGGESLLMLVAFITVNLGVFNLLPLPALDGGRLFFLLIELVIRRPVNQKYEGMVHAIGLILLLGLMLVVTFNDIVKLF